MNLHFEYNILKATGASAITGQQAIQELWSGYGKIIRLYLAGSAVNSVVVKHVQLPAEVKHPRGWGTDISHQRKVRSYEVEIAWYKAQAENCDAHCRIAQCLALETANDEVLIVLEDLDAAGYDQRRSSLSFQEMGPVLKWLASFHATFMNTEPAGLWPTGTYWHLETRPDELAALDDAGLKHTAEAIDR